MIMKYSKIPKKKIKLQSKKFLKKNRMNFNLKLNKFFQKDLMKNIKALLLKLTMKKSEITILILNL